MPHTRSTLKRFIPASWLTARRNYLLMKVIPGMPDRQYMESEILPAFQETHPQTVLWVGCEIYTRGYEKWFTNGSCEYWTMDIRPEVKRWGAKDKHIIGNAIEVDAHFKADYFDIVFLNGVIGWGINELVDQENTLTAIHKITKSGGILLLGWNSDVSQDPLELDSLKANFSQGLGGKLSARKIFPDSTHVYDFLTVHKPSNP